MRLSIDLGSTEFKAAIFADSDAEPAGAGACPLEYVGRDGEVEMKPGMVVGAIKSAVADAAETAGIKLKTVTAVGIDSQAQTFALTDDRLAPTTNFISWLDQRAAAECESMSSNPLFADFAEHSTIAALAPPMTICLLKHLATHSPELFSKNTKILPLPSYALNLLTGAFATDGNLAAMSGVFSLRDRDYRGDYINFIHPRLSRESFPKVLEMGGVVGSTQSANPFGLPAGIPACSCGNDQTAGAYGADLRPGDVLITLGTAQVAYACLDAMPDPSEGLFRGWYPGGLFYAMFAENGGGLVSTAIKQYSEFGDYASFAELAESVEGAPTVECLPDPATNSISWSDDSAKLAEKARSVLEFLTGRMARMLSELKKIAGEPEKIYITGGGTRRKVWLDMLADKIGREPLKIKTSPENGVAKLLRD